MSAQYDYNILFGSLRELGENLKIVSDHVIDMTDRIKRDGEQCKEAKEALENAAKSVFDSYVESIDITKEFEEAVGKCVEAHTTRLEDIINESIDDKISDYDFMDMINDKIDEDMPRRGGRDIESRISEKVEEFVRDEVDNLDMSETANEVVRESVSEIDISSIIRDVASDRLNGSYDQFVNDVANKVGEMLKESFQCDCRMTFWQRVKFILGFKVSK